MITTQFFDVAIRLQTFSDDIVSSLWVRRLLKWIDANQGELFVDGTPDSLHYFRLDKLKVVEDLTIRREVKDVTVDNYDI